jgi:presenilin-like A22 family membrane protease|tara:strand:+ start:1418 stop:2335 length:918 start_codon:yes stop_codon:yes gene_type:complete
MKHTLKITFLLVFIFFITQVIGLAIVNQYINTQEYIDPETKVVTKEIVSEDLPYNMERPQIEESVSYIWILSAIIFGTVLMLILIKYKRMGLWKLWFFLAVFFTMTVAFAAFIPQTIAAILAFILAIIKIYKPTTITQNLTEIFIYGGLAAIFVPVINLFSVFALLILISIYDIIAVKHTKHMVTLAKFQTKSKVFAGLLIPYEGKKGKIAAKEDGIMQNKGAKIAVLGGGDVGFPLIFAGVVMKDLMLGNPESVAFLKVLIIPVFVSLALFYLLVNSNKDKFYPAMPYLTVGCIVGYFAVLLML